MTRNDTTIEHRRMPDDVAEQFRVTLGLSDRPETVGDWVDETVARLDAAGIDFGVEELCLTDDSPHRVHIGEEVRQFACVLDTLLVPFILDPSEAVTVQTQCPVSERPVTAELTDDSIIVTPETAVMSFGIAADSGPPADRGGVLGGGTAQFCPYINGFVDRAAYEVWEEETSEAVTMGLTLEEGFDLAAAISGRLDL